MVAHTRDRHLQCAPDPGQAGLDGLADRRFGHAAAGDEQVDAIGDAVPGDDVLTRPQFPDHEAELRRGGDGFILGETEELGDRVRRAEATRHSCIIAASAREQDRSRHARAYRGFVEFVVAGAMVAVAVTAFFALTTRKEAWYEIRTGKGPKPPRRWRFGAAARQRRGIR